METRLNVKKEKNNKLVEFQSKIGNYNMRKLINEKFVNERESIIKKYSNVSSRQNLKEENITITVTLIFKRPPFPN